MPKLYFSTQVLIFYWISFILTIHKHIYNIKWCVTEKVIQKLLWQLSNKE